MEISRLKSPLESVQSALTFWGFQMRVVHGGMIVALLSLILTGCEKSSPQVSSDPKADTSTARKSISFDPSTAQEVDSAPSEQDANPFLSWLWSCTDSKGVVHWTNDADIAKSSTSPCKYERVKYKSFGEWEKEASAGDAAAQNFVADAFLTGDGVTKDLGKSIEWRNRAASQGYRAAQLALGNAYRDGQGVAKSMPKAIEWWTKAARDETSQRPCKCNDDGCESIGWDGEAPPGERTIAQTEAQAALGFAHLNGSGVPKSITKAVEWWQRAASCGDSDSQNAMGWAYQYGQGVPKDQAKALEWYLRAAKSGNAESQFSVGAAYWNGLGVPKDAAKSIEWFLKAASGGKHEAQLSIAIAFAEGKGVARDLVLAYAWSNLSAAKGNDEAARLRNRIQLPPPLLAEAERLSSKWKEGGAIVREGTGPAIIDEGKSSGIPKRRGSGTAFVVNKEGHAITNYHVVENCKEVRIQGRDGVAKIQVTDSVNDLALLTIPGGITAAATISAKSSDLRQGEEIVVFGFPLNSVLSSGGNLTPGVVSALTGIGNNSNQLQITAPIQPGSSGSPLMNKKGEVVGVVSAKLSDKGMAKATGQIAQTVNFAVSGQTLRAFLDAHKISYRSGGFFSFDKTNADIADDARTWTLLLECWK